jgi:hypothetical protein
MAQVLANRTNAETGTCLPDDVECFSEFLPTADYVGLDSPTLHFRMTARDGRGGVSSADTAVRLAPGTGPFLVTAPDTAATLEGGSTQTVTWDTAGTDAAPIGASDVKISLSTDGGETFQHTLAASTPNDGSAEVELPEVATSRARIKVEAVGNVFFDVSDTDFRIRTAPVITDVDDVEVQYSDAIALPPITATDGDTPGSDLTATATGLPAGISLVVDSTSDGLAPGTRTWRLAGTVEAASEVHHVRVTVTDHEGLQRTVAFDITVRPEDAQLTYVGDELATTGANGSPAAVLLHATVRDDPDANRGDIRNATVTFREGARTLCAAVPVALLGSESTIGSARCSAALGPGAHAIDMTVDGFYAGAGQALIQVARPDGTGVSVAASQRIGTSAGVHPGDPGSLQNVAFNARTSLNGTAAIHIRSGGRTISVTSVDIESAGFAGDVADVRARARLTSAMGPLVQDATLRVRATDRGFDDDSLSLTLWDGDRLLFASEWNGVQTVERPLHSGSVLVF